MVSNGLFGDARELDLLPLMFAAPVQQWLSVTWIAVLPCATRRRVAFWRMCSASISVPAWFAMRVASVPSAAGHEDQRNRRRHQRRHEASNDPQLAEEITGSRGCRKRRGLPTQVYLVRQQKVYAVLPKSLSGQVSELGTRPKL